MISSHRLGSRARRSLAAAVAGLLALTGLATLTNPAAAGAPRSAASVRTAAAAPAAKDWTLMIYDVADTMNLSLIHI